ncbi:MAG: bifunctional acetaldehyde-CoA/alcohol dehydrogenase, partial [Anaerorhabdus sp.]
MAVKKTTNKSNSTKKEVKNALPVETVGKTNVPEVNEKVAKALIALDKYASYDQEKIDYIVAKCSVAALDKHGDLAKLAIEETKRGVFEDKATKNLFACEYVVNHMRHLKT